MGVEENTPETDNQHIDKLLAEYERAQEIGIHTDTVIYEVTAIIWGANTLLLGFILEIPCDSDNQKLVKFVVILGILMTAYVPYINILTKKGQTIAYRICRDIERQLPLPNRLNIRVHKSYPKWRPGQSAVIVLSLCFVLVWVCVRSRFSLRLRSRQHLIYSRCTGP
jgi:hypothetical protein